MNTQGMSRVEIAKAVEAGELSEEEAGRLLLDRAKRQLQKLDEKETEEVQDAEPDSPADEPRARV